MMAALDALNKKTGPLPLWAWGAGAALVAGWYFIRQKNAAGNSTQAAADQTNTNLGSASELANLFEVAGLMPYQGGNTYVNVTEPAGGSTGTVSTSPPSKGGVPIKGGNPPRNPDVPAMPVKTTTGSTQAQSIKSYTVKQGDTMIGIASQQFGLPANESGADTLYNYDGNGALIKKNAQAHGFTTDFVRHIYAGETLKYPGSA
jgi:Tfp pilus assembly protein FimV